MKNNISNIMGKLTGAELGRLHIKDYIGIIAGITPTYTVKDFEIAINTLDRLDSWKFSDYDHLSHELMEQCLLHKINLKDINRYCLTLNFLILIAGVDYSVSKFKEEIPIIYKKLEESIILYFSYRDIFKELSQRLELPELEAVIGDLSDVENINELMAVFDELEDNPYQEIFHKIDIEELKKAQWLNIKEGIEKLMSWVEN
jgi:cytochrome b involved in lipid metabolism